MFFLLLCENRSGMRKNCRPLEHDGKGGRVKNKVYFWMHLYKGS